MAEPMKPEQLDRIEDALESLEDEGVPAEVGDDPEVMQRLEEYREILALSREVIAEHDVPSGILEGVLAAARRDDAAESLPEPLASEPRASWWTRLRRVFLVPGVALAGTAALVLWIVGDDDRSREPRAPTHLDSSTDQMVSTPEGEPEAPEAPAEGAAALAEPAPAFEAKREVADAEEVSQDEDDVAEAAQDRGRRASKRPRRSTSSKADAKPRPPSKKGPAANDAPAKGQGFEPAAPQRPAPAPKAAPEDEKMDASDVLARAERLRRAGSCGKARPLYRQVSKTSDDGIAARALAGLGLCELAEGAAGEAETFFDAARARDSSSAAFIETERADAPPPAPGN